MIDVEVEPAECELRVEHGGEVLVRWRPRAVDAVVDGLEPASEPPPPAAIASADGLYLTGLHLDQYRHATRSPEPYWEEALRRDPGDARCHVALAACRQRDGRLDEAERHLRATVARLTRRNPNPRDGEAHYRLGLVLTRRGSDQEAREALRKAMWDQAWLDAATVSSARLDLAAGRDNEAAEDLNALLERSPRHPQARNLAAVAALRRGDRTRATGLVEGTLRADPLDAWARDLASRLGLAAEPSQDPTITIDVAREYLSIREDDTAADVLERAAGLPLSPGQTNVAPLAWLHRADLELRHGDEQAAAEALEQVRKLDRTWCFPATADNDALERLRRHYPDDPVLAALARHWLYAAGHSDEADQLDGRRGVAPAERLATLLGRRDLVEDRDDLSVQLVEILTAEGREAEALDVLRGREFQPWEGGEGRVLAAWEEAHLSLARKALAAGEADRAVEHATAALRPIASLGEARHLLANTADLHLVLGDALTAAGRAHQASQAWETAAAQQGDFQVMQVRAYSERTAASVTALRRLGRHDEAERLCDGLARCAAKQAEVTARVDYFATSLPTMLLFTEDLQAAHDLRVRVLRAHLALLDDDLDNGER